MKHKSKQSGALNKALAIITLLMEDEERSTLKAISGSLGFDKSTTYRILNVLAEWGFVERAKNEKTYMLGPRLKPLAEWREQKWGELRTAARDFMVRLNELTGATVTLRVIDGLDLITIAKIESKDFLRVSVPLGLRHPCNYGASGKLFLAKLPTEKQEVLLKKGLIKHTVKTITDPAALRREFQMIRKQGHAFSNEEAIEGARGIAAPVYGQSGKMVAALAISLPTVKFPLSRLDELAKQILFFARATSRALNAPSRSRGQLADAGKHRWNRKAARR